MKNAMCLVVLCVCVSLATGQEAGKLTVHADFPGGSAAVQVIDQKARVIRVLPYPHKDLGWVCWWYFKVEGIAPGETLTLDVGGGVWATPERAAFSLDNKSFSHTPPGQRDKGRISYRVKVDGKAAWFAWGPPFVLQDAQELGKTCPHAEHFTLVKSKEGRPVPALRISQDGTPDEQRVGIVIVARQHAWETGGSWVCKGLVDWLLSDDVAAENLRKKASIVVVPIMDVDCVELGAGGKYRKPRDFNRDWADDAAWPQVQAIMQIIRQMDQSGRLHMFLDLHNPGANDRQPFFFTPAEELTKQQARGNLERFLTVARKQIVGPLKLAANVRPSGPKYDPKEWQRISANWVQGTCREHVIAACLETSWNTPHSTAENYERVGRELAISIERYFRDAR